MTQSKIDFESQQLIHEMQDTSHVVHPSLSNKIRYFHDLIETIKSVKEVDATTKNLKDSLVKKLIDIEIMQLANEFVKPLVKKEATFIKEDVITDKKEEQEIKDLCIGDEKELNLLKNSNLIEISQDTEKPDTANYSMVNEKSILSQKEAKIAKTLTLKQKNARKKIEDNKHYIIGKLGKKTIPPVVKELKAIKEKEKRFDRDSETIWDVASVKNKTKTIKKNLEKAKNLGIEEIKEAVANFSLNRMLKTIPENIPTPIEKQTIQDKSIFKKKPKENKCKIAAKSNILRQSKT